MKKLFLLSITLLFFLATSAQEQYDIAFYPATNGYMKTIHTHDSHWAVFQNMIWQIDRVTNEIQTHHLSELISGSDQFSFRTFTDAIALEDGTAFFFTSSFIYFVYENGQLHSRTNFDLVFPAIHTHEEGQLLMSINHGLQLATFDLESEQLEVAQLPGNPTDFSRRIIHIDHEGYYWIASYQDGLRRYKDGVVEEITDTLFLNNAPNFLHRFTSDDQLALWWDNSTIYALHDGKWTTIDLIPFEIFIYRSERTPKNTLLLYGARKVLECSVENGQVKLEDISNQYTPLALASIELSSSEDEHQLFYQKSTQELWRQEAGELPRKIDQLSQAPIYHFYVQQDNRGRIWCLSSEEPFLLLDGQWTGLSEILPANMDRIITMLMLNEDKPLVLKIGPDFRNSLQLYSNGEWQLLNTEDPNSPLPPLSYNRLYQSDQEDIWALDISTGFSLFRNRQRFDFRVTDFFPSPSFVNELYAKKEGLLLISSDLGLYTLEENGDYQFQSFADIGVEYSNTSINGARFGPNGAWWLGNERSVYRYLDGELLRLPEIPIFEQDDVTIKSIYPFASDDVWVTFGTLEISFAHFNGQSWSLFRSEDYDLPLTNVQSIVKEPHSNTYWASGLDGLFKITRGSGSLPAPPARMRSFNVFPNPACCTFSVEWEQNAGEVIISLHNVLGQPVRELLRRSTAAGTFRQTFSRHGLESGTYFLQIKEGDRTKTIPLIIH